ncbi:hypothetical protein HDU98_001131, partial [Podochytrium sp. JEL0797]
AYYLFYNGDNGGGPNNGFDGIVNQMIGLNADLNFQMYNATLLPENAFPSNATCGNGNAPDCMVGYGSILIPEIAMSMIQSCLMQVSFAVIMLAIAGFGDFKSHGISILFWATSISISLHFLFGFVDVNTGNWVLALVMLLVCQVSYNISLSFFYAQFPRLAAHMPSVYAKIDAKCTAKQVDDEIALQRAHISMIATFWSNVGWALPLLLYLGMLYTMNPDPNAFQIDFMFNVNAILFGAYWAVFAIPYYFLSEKRHGPEIPDDTNVYTLGFAKAREAWRLRRGLPEAWQFLFGFFVFSDGVSSSGLIIQNYLQSQYINYDLLEGSFFDFTQAACSMLGCLVFWKVQQHWNLSTKTMLQTSNLLTLLMCAWGLVGLFFNSIGYKSTAEFWFFNLGAGLWQAPIWALEFTYLSDLVPKNKVHLFFGFLCIVNKGCTFLGLWANYLITAIAPSTQQDYLGFLPCTGLAIVGFVIMQRTDPVKGREDVLAYEKAERERDEKQPL